MVVGAKMTLQHVPSKGRISIMKIQNFTVQKRHPFMRLVYGILLVMIGLLMVTLNPVEIFTTWFMDVKEGSFIYHMWEKPTYQLFSEAWIYDYTNVPQYLSGEDKVLKLKEIGPFTFQEIRTNENITVDAERGVMTMKPWINLKFVREKSLADPNDVQLFMPNIALIAMSTLAADKLGFLVNAGAYYSITALGSKLFRNMTAQELMWGYHDPIVTIASKILPGWIDFGKIGILDRFYAQKEELVEVELRDPAKKFSLNTWGGSAGIMEQGFTDLNTSQPCNLIKGSYEGLMLSPKYSLDKTKNIPIYRKQACRVYPFKFDREMTDEHGYNLYRYSMEQFAFNISSEYACVCAENCLPDGFVDVSKCYYGFPITVSKPHFLDADPVQQSYFEGMHPDREKHTSILDLEPNLGVPLSISSKLQVNIAVRMSAGNPVTKPVKDKVLPIMWISLYCTGPPQDVITLLRLRFVIAPPLIITIEVLLFLVGIILGVQASYRIWRPKYILVPKEEKERRKSQEVRRTSLIVSENSAFRDDEMAKEAVSLLSIREEDCDYRGLLITEP